MIEQTEFTLTSSAMKRVEDWKSRLIDLSKKNNLLYFKKGKRGNLTITQPDSQKIFDTLIIKKSRLEFYLPPEEKKPAKTETESPEKQKSRGKAKAKVKEQPEAKVAKGPVKAATMEEQPKKLQTSLSAAA